MTTLKVNRVDLFYEMAGEGEPVVFTHGAWSDGRAWEAVTPHLVDRFRTVVWDRRGHSRSGDGEGPGSIWEDAGDLAALIEHLGGGPVHVVGNSGGAEVVLNLVTMRPDLVATAAAHECVPLALIQTSDDPQIIGMIEQNGRHIARVESLIAEGEHRRAAKYFVENVAIGPGAWEQLPSELHEIMVTNAHTVPDDLRDSFAPDTIEVEALRNTTVPVMLSVGEGLRVEAVATRELARLVPGLELQTLQGTGHIPHRTHPVEYAAMLVRFIEKASIKGSASGVGSPSVSKNPSHRRDS